MSAEGTRSPVTRCAKHCAERAVALADPLQERFGVVADLSAQTSCGRPVH
jgi:hypothetical protein